MASCVAGSAGTLGPLIGELITKRTGADLPSLLPFQSKGKARLLAVTTKTRASLAPDVPTLAEAGYADFDFSTWYALVAPSGTPRSLIGRLNADLAEALRAPEVERQLRQLGMSPRSSTPEAMDELMRQEIDRWGVLIRARR